MEYVDPIKDIEKINEIKKKLEDKSDRDLLLFVLGINTGIRVSDLLKLKVGDVWDEGNPKEFLCILDDKNFERKAYYLNTKVKIALNNYLFNLEYQLDDFLFRSKKQNQPITRQQAYRIINNAAKEVGISGNIGTHTLRKTFGYHAYRKGIAISLLKSIYNHTTPAETLRYIGIDKNEEHHIKIDVNL
ncbi:integrase (plasmid) [Alkalihalophilus pseudofirmus OF4]|uniref:Integrase n=2 Tax=Alkalihalophilus TaxID=2893060 RepID=D3G1T5_ALKPO|nr:MULTISPECIES: tyrosine-type recombinase/integrase [Alkalihalophilus]ADC52311.1 integrase [Alkalihalophilus pseudofirmus OF4]ERN51508.1 integrase [Alkalihalophilus marmarensis DSM 21297]MED1603318.1 tyrosine-type recombinase/integrase [Alkalihalophilus marmarensis]WEG19242.1 tyrosine-type recombinase/integrase [Alkalihalophilus pseudofirmus]